MDVVRAAATNWRDANYLERLVFVMLLASCLGLLSLAISHALGGAGWLLGFFSCILIGGSVAALAQRP